MELKYIVTGTGRCGTCFCAKMLTSVGIPCGHESVYTLDGVVSPFRLSDASLEDHKTFALLEPWVDPRIIVADSSYLAAPHIKDCKATIIHVVREPMLVISSFLDHLKGGNGYFKNDMDAYEKYIHRYLPGLNKIYDPVEKACYFYVKWNEMIEEGCRGRNFYFHRIEDGIDGLCKFLDVDPCNAYDDKKSNTFRFFKEKFWGWDGIPSGEIKDSLLEMSKRYGY